MARPEPGLRGRAGHGVGSRSSPRGEDDVIEQSVVGMGAYGVQGVVPCPEMAGFVLTYVREGEDLEPHRPMADTLIRSWEKRDRDALDDDPSRN